MPTEIRSPADMHVFLRPMPYWTSTVLFYDDTEKGRNARAAFAVVEREAGVPHLKVERPFAMASLANPLVAEHAAELRTGCGAAAVVSHWGAPAFRVELDGGVEEMTEKLRRNVLHVWGAYSGARPPADADAREMRLIPTGEPINVPELTALAPITGVFVFARWAPAGEGREALAEFARQHPGEVAFAELDADTDLMMRIGKLMAVGNVPSLVWWRKGAVLYTQIFNGSRELTARMAATTYGCILERAYYGAEIPHYREDRTPNRKIWWLVGMSMVRVREMAS